MSLILSGTDGLSDVDGTAATPAIRGTDANTGIFFPAADTIAFSEGGVEAMRIDSSGNLGLGVASSPWGSGQIAMDIGLGSSVWNPGTATQTQLLTNSYFDNTNFIYKGTGAASRYRMTGAQHEWHTAPSGTAGNAITFTQAMTLDASGNLLLAGTSQRQRITVGTTAVTSTATPEAIDLGATFSSAAGQNLKIYTFNDGSTKHGIGVSTSSSDYVTPTGGRHTFYVNTSEVARIDSSGNLGIGTTTTDPYSLGSGGKTLAMNCTTAGTGTLISMASGGSARGYFYANNTEFRMSAYTAIPIIFKTSDTERARIDSSGNVGIGTSSPSTFGKVAVEVAGTTTPTSLTTVGPSSINLYAATNGVSTNGTTGIFGWTATTGIGSGIGFSRENSADWGTQIRFYTHPTATSNIGDITERMRIDSSGNLLVGVTSGTSYKLSLKTSLASQSAIGTAGTSGDTAFQSILVTKFDNDSTTSQNFIQFQINNGGANCGKITANGANTAAFGSTSDQRVKENIAELPSQLANIMALRPVEFDYLESYGGGHQIGFIAQEIQQVYPDVISTDDSSEKIMSITGWSKTEARLVKAIQEQQALITQLTARITALEGA